VGIRATACRADGGPGRRTGICRTGSADRWWRGARDDADWTVASFRGRMELTEFMMGPQPEPDGPTRDPKWSVIHAEVELADELDDRDVAAIIHFLRKVVWIVRGFTMPAYRDQLRLMHEHLTEVGPFRATTTTGG
jgi:hypothetical protein